MTVAGTRGAHVANLAREWSDRLDDLEKRLEPENIEAQALLFGDMPNGDGVSTDNLRRNRDALLGAIRFAQRYFTGLQ